MPGSRTRLLEVSAGPCCTHRAAGAGRCTRRAAVPADRSAEGHWKL